jgi:hypothetical protein
MPIVRDSDLAPEKTQTTLTQEEKRQQGEGLQRLRDMHNKKSSSGLQVRRFSISAALRE